MAHPERKGLMADPALTGLMEAVKLAAQGLGVGVPALPWPLKPALWVRGEGFKRPPTFAEAMEYHVDNVASLEERGMLPDATQENAGLSEPVGGPPAAPESPCPFPQAANLRPRPC